MTTLVLPYPPSANHYKVRANGVTYLTEAARQFKAACGLLARSQAGDEMPLQGRVAIEVRLYRPQKSGDLDNFLKVLLDSLNGIAWKDDKQIVEIHAYRYEDKHNPRAEVKVTECTN